MQKVILLSALIILIVFVNTKAQTLPDSANAISKRELKGLVLDIDKQTPLPYANIYVLHKNIGVISNEKGYFSINMGEVAITDTLRFQYIGYKTRKLAIDQLDSSLVVYLRENIINLNEILVFGKTHDAKSIVKKVLENKDSNYRKTTSKKLVFIRDRDISEFDKINFNLKKSTISQLDNEMIKYVEESFPEQFISYTDFLGDIYFSGKPDDSVSLKIDPHRAVSLKEKDYTELKQIESVFEDIFSEIGKKEYWKMKSGIFSQKIAEDQLKNDTVKENNEPENDSLNKPGRLLKYYARRVKSQIRYSLLNDKDQWEFLHKTGRYNYILAGGTRVNGEDVYIIDFTPKSSGRYIGRMYISISTFALIRADYEYGKGKVGRDIHLFGVGYTENQFSGSIYFEKKDDNYVLKYFSKKAGFNASFDRKVALLKKRKRSLFDKKLKEIKVGIDMLMYVEESTEYVVLDDKEISRKNFSGFEQMEKMEVVFVDQFDDKLWKGYSIIEPTQQMREYKKQE